MKNFFKDNSYLKTSLYAIFVAIITILFYRISSNTDNIAPSIMSFFNSIINVLLPILYGFLIAYLFNPIMMFFENIFTKWFLINTKRTEPTFKSKKVIRTLSIFSVYICILGTLVLMVRYLVPQIYNNIKDLLDIAPGYIDDFSAWLEALEISINDNLALLPYSLDTTKIFDTINPTKILNMDIINNFISQIMSHTFTITSSLYNIIMGLVIAFYMLTQKEDFSIGAKRVMFSLLKQNHATRIVSIFSEGHAIFIRFFVGKFIDSFIIGIICFVGLSIMKNPYSLLIAIIVGVFNMIPYFGPILGAIPSIIITLFTGLMPALFVAIFIICLQQFDGLVLGPKILGDSIGLSPFWIISGIIIGGAIWGPLGMFFASPIVAVILKNISRWTESKLRQKKIDPALISATKYSAKE